MDRESVSLVYKQVCDVLHNFTREENQQTGLVSINRPGRTPAREIPSLSSWTEKHAIYCISQSFESMMQIATHTHTCASTCEEHVPQKCSREFARLEHAEFDTSNTSTTFCNNAIACDRASTAAVSPSTICPCISICTHDASLAL